MKHPPDRIDVAEGLRRILKDLSVVERWTEGAGPGRPEPYADDESWDGPEYRVETVSHDSMHTVVAIAVCDPTRMPTGRDGPGEDEAAALRSTVRALLDLAGMASGPARTTIVLTARGPRVVSCRIGSAETVFARERVSGRD